MEKEGKEEIKFVFDSCANCVYSESDSIACNRDGGCGATEPNAYYSKDKDGNSKTLTKKQK